MQSGVRDKRITFQSFTPTKDDYGGEVETWANLASVPAVWAQVIESPGKEAFNTTMDQRQAAADAVFRILYRSDITSEMRIVYNSRTYDIIGQPRELGRREGLEIVGKIRTDA